ncbi:MAG: chaperone NapD [Gammaproteobacteria bacterium]|nr:chaperone NapD [Gammaproteobacteria bacterium]
MNICGILVNARPENVAAVTQRLVAIPGMEVHASSDEGQMVVTLEEFEEDATAEKMLGIQKVEGVISASMIYHHYEDEALGEEVAQ